MKTHLKKLWIALMVAGGLGFSALPTAAQETRSFYMGFTTFPYAVSQEAVDYTFTTIGREADLIAFSFDNGVPWVEALQGQPFHPVLEAEWKASTAKIPKNHRRYVQVSPIALLRNGLALYRGAQGDMPLPSPWDKAKFDDPEVIKAYVYYCQRLIQVFEPDYLGIGIEVNLLMTNAPDLWDGFVRFHREVYQTLKAAYPDLTILTTFHGTSLIEGYLAEANHESQMKTLRDLIDYTDVFALSLYPYLTSAMTFRIPETLISDLVALAPGKPLAISEMGYPAQDLILTQTPLTMPSTPDKQNQWIQVALEAAQQYRFQFVVNYVLRDYDALWELVKDKGDLMVLWRDTGVFDEQGGERPALQTWRGYLKRPVQP